MVKSSFSPLVPIPVNSNTVHHSSGQKPLTPPCPHPFSRWVSLYHCTNQSPCQRFFIISHVVTLAASTLAPSNPLILQGSQSEVLTREAKLCHFPMTVLQQLPSALRTKSKPSPWSPGPCITGSLRVLPAPLNLSSAVPSHSSPPAPSFPSPRPHKASVSPPGLISGVTSSRKLS